jgi:hypothetical protein
MVITAWVEAGTEVRLTARIRRLIDVGSPKGNQVVSAASSAEMIHSTVDSWLADLLAFEPPPGSDAAVTNG